MQPVRYLAGEYRYATPTLLSKVCQPWHLQLRHEGNLPVLSDIERPLELQVSLLVVVNKGRDGVIVTASQHSRGGILLLD